VTQQYIDELVNTYASIREVWLLGSRADGDTALSPWPESHGHQKKLGLGDTAGGLNWYKVSDTETSYTQTKERNPPSSPAILASRRPCWYTGAHCAPHVACSRSYSSASSC
jgi:hypothetical protein